MNLDEIFEDGHWQLLGSHPSRADYSPFVNKKDARKVRSKKTPIQKGGFKGKVPGLQERIEQRLAEEKEETVTVCVDFDGTLAEDVGHPEIGDPRKGAKEAMDQLHEAGVRIIIFTCRGQPYEDLIREWLDHHEIPFDFINRNPDQPKDASSKVMADLYIDDRAINARRDWREIIKEVLQILGKDDIKEDQYKSPSTKYTRKQSAFPSSFGPSKSFGGISTRRKRKLAEAISGEMQPVRFEPERNYGIVSAGRTSDDSATDTGRRGTKLQSYKDRRDLTDLPTTIKFNQMSDPIYYDATYQHVIPGTKTGTADDPRSRPLFTGKAVPNAMHEPFEEEGEEYEPEFDDVEIDLDEENPDKGHPGLVDRHSYKELHRLGYSMEMTERLDFICEALQPGIDEVGADDPLTGAPDVAEDGRTFVVMVGDEPVYFNDKKSMMKFMKEHADEITKVNYMDIPMGIQPPSANVDKLGERLENRFDEVPNMRPLGVFGPRDDRAPSGGPVSNVAVQHPPDRSFDANSPKVSVRKKTPTQTANNFHRELKHALGQG